MNEQLQDSISGFIDIAGNVLIGYLSFVGIAFVIIAGIGFYLFNKH